jgi:hypothetical protein
MLSPVQIVRNLSAKVYMVDFKPRDISNTTYALLYNTVRKHGSKKQFYQPLETLLNIHNVRDLTEEGAISIINFLNANPMKKGEKV